MWLCGCMCVCADREPACVTCVAPGSGVQVTAGYLNRPDLNESTFVPNPLCEGPGTYTEVMYKTGDLVRWLPGKRACIE